MRKSKMVISVPEPDTELERKTLDNIVTIAEQVGYRVKTKNTNDEPIEPRPEYTDEEQIRAIVQCVNILDFVGLELIGTRPKDRG